MVELKSLNLSGIGRMGGQERENWRKFFSTEGLARRFAECDYKDTISWRESGGRISSGDLGYVMYEISVCRVEA